MLSLAFLVSVFSIAFTVCEVVTENGAAIEECPGQCCASLNSLQADIKTLTEAVNKLQADHGARKGRNEYPLTFADGARWRAFWWFKPRTPWPAHEDDVLKEEYGTCRSSDAYCFSRLPSILKENITEMLGEDSAGTIYRWKFDPSNAIAHATWAAFHNHETGKLVNRAAWNPKVVKGSAPPVAQDSVMYRKEHGVASFMIDDDNCDCKTSLSMGHGMCLETFSTQYGTEWAYGVDLLHDPACHSPNSDNGLTLYFKDDDDCLNVTCPAGTTCHDDIYSYTCE